MRHQGAPEMRERNATRYTLHQRPRILVPTTVALLSIATLVTAVATLLPAASILVLIVATAAVLLSTEASLARLVVTAKATRHSIVAERLFTTVATSSSV